MTENPGRVPHLVFPSVWLVGFLLANRKCSSMVFLGHAVPKHTALKDLDQFPFFEVF
jgi:hypothetical protein